MESKGTTSFLTVDPSTAGKPSRLNRWDLCAKRWSLTKSPLVGKIEITKTKHPKKHRNTKQQTGGSFLLWRFNDCL